MHVLIPLRSPGHGLTRLGPDLTAATRARIAAALLADVVAAVRGAGLDPTVVASGPTAAAAASALGCNVTMDPVDAGLNAALHHATSSLPPDASVLVLLADPPLVTGEDVAALLDQPQDVVLAPTDDRGTSALVRRPHTVMPTAFGPSSAAAHRELAASRGASVLEVARPGLARDLDTVDDLRGLDLELVGPTLRRVLLRVEDE